jgi:uncharacterized protein (TIGR04222 family)
VTPVPAFDPFDLRGPAFLAFYSGAGLLALLLVLLPRRLRFGAPARLRDPCAIAFLRGGEMEAVRTATLSLVGRGLLEERTSGFFGAKDPEAAGSASDPLERAVLGHFEVPGPPAAVFGSNGVRRAVAALADRLRREGLLLAGPGRAAYGAWCLLVLGALAWVGVHKIQVAVARGRSNVGFLALEIAAFLVAGTWLACRGAPRSPAGGATLSGLRELFRPARERARLRPSAEAVNPALLFAVFGAGDVLPGAWRNAWAALRPPPSTGSSDGSSFASSCGSSCGGGGGCGGCGG